MRTTDHRERMLAGVGATARTIQVDGVATAVIEAGDGPPLLLLHGGIECGGAMLAPVLSLLAEHHHVVVPDIPGLGESAPVARLDVDTFGCWRPSQASWPPAEGAVSIGRPDQIDGSGRMPTKATPSHHARATRGLTRPQGACLRLGAGAVAGP